MTSSRCSRDIDPGQLRQRPSTNPHRLLPLTTGESACRARWVWGYPLLPALFLLASLVLIGNALVTDPRDTGITLLIIAVGLPAYAVWKWLERFSARRAA